MTKLVRNMNTSLSSKSLLKEQTIRNNERDIQPSGRNQIEREFYQNQESQDELTKTYVRQLFSQRPCIYKKKEFVPSILEDPTIHPNSEKQNSLSPNARLRKLKTQV